MSWAELSKKTFAFDVLHCQRCGGRARILAATTQRSVIDKILTHLDLATKRQSVPAAPRAPPSQLSLLDTQPT